jgi:hypothetical protein
MHKNFTSRMLYAILCYMRCRDVVIVIVIVLASIN